MRSTWDFAEPGVLFVSDYNHVTNPCAEIGLDPVLVNEDGTTSTGWAMCNLTEINASKLTSFEDFSEAAWAATLIGTMQATYTDMPFLGKVTEAIVRRDALLGIGMTGMQDAPHVACNPSYQRAVAQRVVAWNAEWAAILGINPAARTTCVKPSGTTSLELGNVGSGIHPHHARRYFRRVQANRKEPVYAFFKAANPQMTEPSVYNPDTDDVITFPVEAPKKAILRKDLTAVQFLELVKLVQQSWVIPGGDPQSRAPDLHHNVSNTCTVSPTEWDEVAEFIWSNRRFFTGISLFQDAGDKAYAQAPREEVMTEADIVKWNALRPGRVDYTQMREVSDETELKQTAACAGGACELV